MIETSALRLNVDTLFRVSLANELTVACPDLRVLSFASGQIALGEALCELETIQCKQVIRERGIEL